MLSCWLKAYLMLLYLSWCDAAKGTSASALRAKSHLSRKGGTPCSSLTKILLTWTRTRIRSTKAVSDTQVGICSLQVLWVCFGWLPLPLPLPLPRPSPLWILAAAAVLSIDELEQARVCIQDALLVLPA